MGQKKKLKNMKKRKHNNKKKSIIAIMGILFLFVLINLVNAEILFHEQRYNLQIPTANNQTDVYDFFYMDYNHSSNDQVIQGQYYEVYLLYSTNILQWNQLNLNNEVTLCTLYITRYAHGNYTTLYNENFTEDTDVQNKKYFILMSDGDSDTARFDCYFNDPTYSGVDMPITLSINAPTQYCKACQYTDWYELQGNVQAKTMQSNTATVLTYIQKFSTLIFEFIVYIFWLFLIAMFFFAIGMIFWAIYFVYLWLIQLEK